MTKHSPLPWRSYNASGSRIFKTWRIRNDEDDSVIAIIPDDCRHSPEQMHANAHYIVTACNAFPALVEALENVLDMLDAASSPLIHSIQFKAAESALALARGEKGESK